MRDESLKRRGGWICGPIAKPRGSSVGLARPASPFPTDSVAQIIEYDLASPLPLARKLIGGLAVFEDRMLVSVALSWRDDRNVVRRRRAKGVLLNASSGGDIGWVIEVLEIGTLSA